MAVAVLGTDSPVSTMNHEVDRTLAGRLSACLDGIGLSAVRGNPGTSLSDLPAGAVLRYMYVASSWHRFRSLGDYCDHPTSIAEGIADAVSGTGS